MEFFISIGDLLLGNNQWKWKALKKSIMSIIDILLNKIFRLSKELLIINQNTTQKLQTTVIPLR
jgi:hypothetical protein